MARRWARGILVLSTIAIQVALLCGLSAVQPATEARVPSSDGTSAAVIREEMARRCVGGIHVLSTVAIRVAHLRGLSAVQPATEARVRSSGGTSPAAIREEMARRCVGGILVLSTIAIQVAHQRGLSARPADDRGPRSFERRDFTGGDSRRDGPAMRGRDSRPFDRRDSGRAPVRTFSRPTDDRGPRSFERRNFAGADSRRDGPATRGRDSRPFERRDSSATSERSYHRSSEEGRGGPHKEHRTPQAGGGYPRAQSSRLQVKDHQAREGVRNMRHEPASRADGVSRPPRRQAH